jgi:hypothetical protein
VSDDKSVSKEEPRAEELIATILAQKQRRLSEGENPVRVVLSRTQYRIIQDYRNHLGEASSTSLEYLTRYEIFGLEICVEGNRAAESEPAVE